MAKERESLGSRSSNALLARVFLFRILIPELTECHSIHSAPRGRMNRMLRMKSKMADGEMSAADSNTSLQGKKSGYTFGQNEKLLLVSLYQNYKENCCDNGCNGSLFVGRRSPYLLRNVYSARTDGGFFMQTIRIIPSIPYQPFLFQNCG